MRNDIRLFIGDKEIEFSQDPKILLNYKEKELHNPTIVKNSFTKQITIDGTPGNNKVFDHIWNLERVQDGINFNPIRKTDFKLYVNDELFQRGYVKLDKVTRTNNTTKYSLTLYGNLGSFFYNLTYDQDDYGNTKKTLASLNYRTNLEEEPVLDFTIDKDTVYDAWGKLTNTVTTASTKWNIINFIPALNGIPGDFDASKILINNKNLGGGFQTVERPEGTGGPEYTPVINGQNNYSGYSLAEMEEDLQEWQTRDLRSYNQRPCINMRRVIQACCRPENNGGYMVKLDNHFFHDKNPYWQNAWMTLPMLKDLDGVGGGETYDITGATISNPTTQYSARLFQVGFNTPAASINNVRMNVSVHFEPESTTNVTNLYPHHYYNSPGTTIKSRTYVREAEWNSGVIMQMFALGQGGQVIGQSKAYLLSGTKYYADGKDPMWQYFWDPDEFNGDIGSKPDYEYVEGYFKKINGSYVFVNPQGQQTDIQFSFSAPTDFTSLILKVKTPYAYNIKYAVSGTEYHSNPNTTVRCCYTQQTTNTSGNHTIGEAQNQDRVDGDYTFHITSFEGVATDYEGLFSGTKITKDRLLTTEYSPADYLLSYCKLFGLYFYYDSTEDADDPELCPSGVVHIMDRDTFYTEEVVDLEKKIDWNKNMEITPAMADAKWYKFDVEHIDSQLETGYKEQFGRAYGSQTVNTNYNFDNNTTNLYDGNVFKSATMALEKDKYYKKTSNGLPVYQYNGLTYTLFHRNNQGDEFDTVDIEYPVKTIMYLDSVNPDYEYYNVFPMLQLHGDDNSPVDGSNILVFLQSSVQAPSNYWLTDDINEMIYLNDASPCWIMTNSATDAAGQTIAKKVTYFPYFTRDLITTGGEYGNVIHSWNFGHPQVIYSPDTYTTKMDSIYDVCWEKYIGDLYSVNTRKLTCYVKAEMDEHPWPYWFRRFYWFQNSIWVLNEIKDLNLGSFDVTKMEFIKVQDMENYKLDKIQYQGTNTIILDSDTVPCSGGVMTGSVRLQAGGEWGVSYIYGLDGHGNYTFITNNLVPSSGSGFSTPFTLTVPANTGDTAIDWTMVVNPQGLGWSFNATFTQPTCDTGSTLELSPSLKSVSAPPGTTTLTLTAIRVSNTAMTVSENWVSASISGNVVTLTYERNTGASVRTANITITGTGADGTMSTSAVLRQEPVGEVNVYPSTVYIDWNDTSAHGIGVTTGDEWYTIINDN